jgi:hypothetical protein
VFETRLSSFVAHPSCASFVRVRVPTTRGRSSRSSPGKDARSARRRRAPARKSTDSRRTTPAAPGRPRANPTGWKRPSALAGPTGPPGTWSSVTPAHFQLLGELTLSVPVSLLFSSEVGAVACTRHEAADRVGLAADARVGVAGLGTTAAPWRLSRGRLSPMREVGKRSGITGRTGVARTAHVASVSRPANGGLRRDQVPSQG